MFCLNLLCNKQCKRKSAQRPWRNNTTGDKVQESTFPTLFCITRYLSLIKNIMMLCITFPYKITLCKYFNAYTKLLNSSFSITLTVKCKLQVSVLPTVPLFNLHPILVCQPAYPPSPYWNDNISLRSYLQNLSKKVKPKYWQCIHLRVNSP